MVHHTARTILVLLRTIHHLHGSCRLGKLLVYATFFGTLAPALTVAAAMSLRSPFLTPFDQQVGWAGSQEQVLQSW
jgi:hypothetical protein